ncbi:MAG: hypothetical protein GJT30_14950 [Geobacter sp.]|nr:hypothetical protein [Geobacter sp.]
MKDDRLVYSAEQQINDEHYCISVYCRSDGRHYAKTFLSETDIIINDGSSLEEVLRIHRDLLPLAVTSRRSREILRSPRQELQEA